MTNNAKPVDQINPDSLPDHEKDLPERIQSFNEEFIALLGKHELGLAAQASLTPDGRIIANPVIVSARKAPEQAAAEGQNEGIVNPEA